MITDPGTTPVRPWRQAAFGAAAAAIYGLLVYLHVVFGLFFCLVIVCALRGAGLAALSVRSRRIGSAQAEAPASAPHLEPATVARAARALARAEQVDVRDV